MVGLDTGTIVDRYVVEGRIGKGGMAVVYRVRHKDLDSTHALKVLTVHSDSIRARLRQEGKAQARLRHPNIVSVTDLIDVRGAPGLIMECVDGPDLSQVMPLIQGNLGLADNMARGIIAGLQEAHRLGMVHRDLKPGNILVAKQGQQPVPKITDFGLVKVLLAEDSGEHSTQAGSTMGTPAYMAPEQIRDPRLVDARADIFSLGVILYELVCGVLPFVGKDMLDLFTAITSGDFVPPRELVPQLPERMERAILGALEVQREQRIPDCRVLFEVWEGRLVDWKAQSLDQAGEPGSRWSEVLDSAWSPKAELSNSMTAVPSSLEPHPVAPPPGGQQPDDGATFYGEEPPELQSEQPAAPVEGGADATFYHPPVEADEGLPSPSQAVVPAAPPPEEPAELPPKRGPLPWVLGGGALLALVVGGLMLMPPADEPAPSDAAPTVDQPEPVAAEPEPVEAEEPVEPQPEEAVVELAVSEPVAPSPAPPPEPVVPEPEPAVTEAAPEAPPEPAIEPAPVAAPTTASVQVEGGVRVWLVGSVGQFPPGEIPPGSYTVKAFFDPLEPMDAGSFEAAAGDELVVRCSVAMNMCTTKPR
jgi:serine/threonine protein kinase